MQKCDVIIIGGGIVGCSTALHVAEDTERSVILLEREQLTSGTTWHAAGLVAELRASANLTRLARYSGELYESLTDQGEATGFRRVGALTLATNEARKYELQKLAAMGRANAVDCRWLEPRAIGERWPHIDIHDVMGGVYMPNDGQTNPVDTTLALAREAKRHGAVIREHSPVFEILTRSGRAIGVRTPEDTYHAEQVLIACGLWSRALGLSVGADFPLYPAEHFYAVTEPVSMDGDQPIVRVPDDGIYIKPDAGRLLIGCFEREAKPLAPERIGDDFAYGELPFDLEHFAPYLDAALKRIPSARDIGIRTWFNGPESFTPDGRYLLGESPQVEGLFIAAGFNSIGIQSAGGVGRVMAAWLKNKRPPMDLWEVDVRRFAPMHNRLGYLVPRTAESLGLLYAMHWPYFQPQSARGQRTSPLHHRLAARGACFGELAGWERANWYGAAGSEGAYDYTYGKPKWFAQCRRECHAVRNAVALFDQTSFAKYLVSGPDACAFLNRLSTANLDVPVDKVVYCQWLNERGGIEADVTVTRIDANTYWVISAAACTVRDLDWMRRQRLKEDIEIREMTDDYAVIGIMGPEARARLQPLTETSLAHDDFAFATSRRMAINGVDLRATRITYVGELGWELYVARADALRVYDALTAQPIAHAGYHAMDSLRMEKGYRHWGHDITDEDTPLQAGLSFTVAWDKPEPFIGKDALLEARAREGKRMTKRLTLFKLNDPDTLLTHDEPIWRDDEIVGYVRSSAYSHTLNATLAFGYVTHATGMTRSEVLTGSYTIEVADRRRAVTPSLRAMVDPTNERIHC